MIFPQNDKFFLGSNLYKISQSFKEVDVELEDDNLSHYSFNSRVAILHFLLQTGSDVIALFWPSGLARSACLLLVLAAFIGSCRRQLALQFVGK